MHKPIIALSLSPLALQSATLASAVVAHETMNAMGERLLDESYVNAVLVLVVATCVAGPILAGRYAKQLSCGANSAPEPASPAGALS